MPSNSNVARLSLKLQKRELGYSMRNLTTTNRRTKHYKTYNLILRLQHQELFGD